MGHVSAARRPPRRAGPPGPDRRSARLADLKAYEALGCGRGGHTRCRLGVVDSRTPESAIVGEPWRAAPAMTDVPAAETLHTKMNCPPQRRTYLDCWGRGGGTHRPPSLVASLAFGLSDDRASWPPKPGDSVAARPALPRCPAPGARGSCALAVASSRGQGVWTIALIVHNRAGVRNAERSPRSRHDCRPEPQSSFGRPAGRSRPRPRRPWRPGGRRQLRGNPSPSAQPRPPPGR